MHPITYFYPTGHGKHFQVGHPERPDRVETIVKSLDGLGLWEPYPKLPALEIPAPVLEGIHTPQLLRRLAALDGREGHIDADTFVTPSTYALAIQAAGGACAVAAAVWNRSANRGFALSRPPGHHATPGEAMGFCFLNNIAIAAEYLLQVMGARKLAIVDLDIHHGNGTQDIFYARGDVFFASTHQHPLYPGTGALSETGAGPGAMTTLNVPLPPFSGDTASHTAMDQLILPALERFQPEMLLISAGMDAHWRDPLGHLLFTADGYRGLIERLTAFADAGCGGRIALVLEGGYDLIGCSACASGAVAAMLGLPFADPAGRPPYREGEDWQAVIRRGKQIFAL